MTATDPMPSDLAAAVAAYEAALPPGVRYSFDLSPLDDLGLPVFVEVLVLDGVWYDGHGYGATPVEARVGALGELSEVVHLGRALRADPGVSASFADMAARYGDAAIDPRALVLSAGSLWAPTDVMNWVRVRRWPEGDAWVPREFVASDPGMYRAGVEVPPPAITPITNGCGAGRTVEQALAHGVLELVQRDGNGTRFRAMDRGVVVDLDGLADPDVVALLARLRAGGVEPLVKLASTEWGMANLYVVDGGTAEPRMPLQATGCGEAAHPDPVFALRKALLEFAASRCRKAMMHGDLAAVAALAPAGYLDTALAAVDPAAEEPRALHAMADWVGRSAAELRALLRPTVLSERGRVPFASLPSVPAASVRDPAARLADIVARLDLPVLFYDASPPGGPAVVKAIVPGTEVETMSYGRIGGRGLARLLAEGTPSGRTLVGLGAAPAGAAAIRLTPAEAARIGPAWLDPAALDAEVGALYPLYREPASHAVAVLREAASRRPAAAAG